MRLGPNIWFDNYLISDETILLFSMQLATFIGILIYMCNCVTIHIAADIRMWVMAVFVG